MVMVVWLYEQILIEGIELFHGMGRLFMIMLLLLWQVAEL
jgi:hypothetical protein